MARCLYGHVSSLASPKTLVAQGPANWERADVTIVKQKIDTTYGSGVYLTGVNARPQLVAAKECLKRKAKRTYQLSLPTAPPSSASIAGTQQSPSNPVVEPEEQCPDLNAAPLRISAQQPSITPTTISRVKQSSGRISFHVDRPGVPVVVRTSYFPNWKARGATGPYRATPNVMVVVPAKNDVSLDYVQCPINHLGNVISVGSLGAISAVSVRARRRRRRRAMTR